jgi:mono/diheme cytochrome c family protein
MPTFQGQLSEEQVLALVAYVRAIGPGPGSPPPQLRPSPPPRPPVEPRSTGTPLPAQGDVLFEQLGCSGCHRAAGQPIAPRLEGLYGQTVRFQDGSQTVADDAYIRRSILDPSAQVVEGFQPIMPPFQGRVNEDQLQALVTYIQSIGPAQGTASPQPSPSPLSAPLPAPSRTGRALAPSPAPATTGSPTP